MKNSKDKLCLILTDDDFDPCTEQNITAVVGSFGARFSTILFDSTRHFYDDFMTRLRVTLLKKRFIVIWTLTRNRHIKFKDKSIDIQDLSKEISAYASDETKFLLFFDVYNLADPALTLESPLPPFYNRIHNDRFDHEENDDFVAVVASENICNKKGSLATFTFLGALAQQNEHSLRWLVTKFCTGNINHKKLIEL